MRDELRQIELDAQKKRLVDTFYKEVNRAYGLRPEGRIDYNQFGIGADGKTLYWTPDDKKIPITATRGKVQFLALGTLARRYGNGGTYALRRSLGLTDYRSGVSWLGKEAVETLQNAEETLLKNIENRAEGRLRRDQRRYSNKGDVETTLKTIDNPQMDVAWATQATRDLAGVMGGHDENERQPGEAVRCRQPEIRSQKPLGPGA